MPPDENKEVVAHNEKNLKTSSNKTIYFYIFQGTVLGILTFVLSSVSQHYQISLQLFGITFRFASLFENLSAGFFGAFIFQLFAERRLNQEEHTLTAVSEVVYIHETLLEAGEIVTKLSNSITKNELRRAGLTGVRLGKDYTNLPDILSAELALARKVTEELAELKDLAEAQVFKIEFLLNRANIPVEYAEENIRPMLKTVRELKERTIERQIENKNIIDFLENEWNKALNEKYDL